MKLLGKHLLLAVSIFFAGALFAQDSLNVDENRLRLEFEPGLFFNNGRSLLGLYTITDDYNLSAGLYLMTSDVPNNIASNIFSNYSDTTLVRVTEEYAVNIRYRIRLSKKYESNPYVGMIFGWENFRFSHEGKKLFDYTTFILTPHVGYEFYLYKKMFYLNPQLRGVFYMGGEKTDETRSEELKSALFLPSIAVGLRL